MQPRIETLKEKKLVGVKMKMSLAEDGTFALWQSFMPRLKEIADRTSDDKFSMQIYEDAAALGDFRREFEKWAAVEVEDFAEVTGDLETFVLRGGLYAVFDYKGEGADGHIFKYIFTEWLPASRYALDDRPHFEILGEKYKNGDPNSEEQIWIPIKAKQS